MSIFGLILSFLVILEIHCADICQRYNCKDADKTTTNCLFESTDRRTNGEVDTFKDYCPKKNNATHDFLCKYVVALGAPLGLPRDVLRGECYPKAKQRTDPIFRYPGEVCDDAGSKYACITGYRRCEHGRCKGFERGQFCQTTADCDPSLYCKNGKCTYFEPRDAVCYDKYACGRDSKCLVTSSSGSYPGTCVPYYSVPDGAVIRIENDFDHFLCRSGAVNDNELDPNYLKCGNGGLSKNKGKECDGEFSCPTTNNKFLTCDCVLDSSALKYCPPHYGDTEWREVFELFKKYLEATSTCHVVRGFDEPCDNPGLHSPFMCAYLKFSKYHKTNKVSRCLYDMANDQLFPELVEAKEFCGVSFSERNILFISFLVLITILLA